VSREQLANLDCEIPPLPEQRAIAGILGALDDKIELNRHMNVTLEAMARAVFLEMMKNGEGEERTIGDVVTVVGGSTPSTTNPAFWDGGVIHWATPKDLAHLQSPILLDSNSCISELGLKGISSGLLPIGTVLLSSRAPIGYLAITQIPVAINQGFIAIKCTEEVPNYFILNWLKENMEEIIGRANGTTFLEISKSNFRPMKVIVPLPRKMKAFVVQVEPMYLKIVANLKEARTLARLRDSLLPKLMRGDVSVKGIER
jgi:type I restriction enzyme S subunit